MGKRDRIAQLEGVEADGEEKKSGLVVCEATVYAGLRE